MSNSSDGDRRKVSTDALETLGMKIGPNEKRDAIHLAVIPMEAKAKLWPGQHVTADGWPAPQRGIGIVDPFLEGPVHPGERFWLMICPRMITSLRHVWTHPAFADEPEGVAASNAAVESTKEASERWLREFIDNSDCPDYETVIAKALSNDGWSPEFLHFNGDDAHGEIPPEFYLHLEIVTGISVPLEHRATSFFCSC